MSGATSFTSVPIVDISGLRSPDRTERERVAAEIGSAAREVGFLYISGSGIDEALFDRMLAATKEFFALPLEEKMRSYIGLSRCHRGYVPVGEEGVETGTPDLKEAFDTALDLPADDPDYLAGNPMLGPNTWPDLPGFADAVTAYYRGGARGRAPAAVGVRGGTRRGSRRVLAARHQDAEPAAARALPVQRRRPGRVGHRRAHRLRVLHAAQADRAGTRGAQRGRASGSTCRR